MRAFLSAVLAAFAIAGGASLPAEASAGANLPAAGLDRGAWPADGSGPRLQLARATFDDDDDNDARPVRRRRDGAQWNRQHHAKPRHVHSTKRAAKRTAKRAWHRTARPAAKRRHIARRSIDRTAGTAVRATRRAAVPAAPTGTDVTGVASFYWQGQKTATGERFNPEGMTAAHRSLPFGTRVRVTHLGSGRTVDVRINDRGPFIAGRIIDLSRGAAGVIGMHGQGLARVKVTVLGR